MDFTSLAVKNESFCHLRHPATDELLYTENGDKIGFNVAGVDSDIYRKVQADILRSETTFKKKISLEKAEQMSLKQVIGVITGVVNVVDNGEPVKKDFDSLKFFFEKYRWAKEQVSDYINDRANFL